MTRTIPPPPELRRLRITSAVFLLVVVAGVLGYRAIEGMSVADAVYMTVITVSTVGFGEVVPLGVGGQVLTVALIVAGVGSVSYAAVTAAEFVVEGHLGRYIERRRMTRIIDGLRDHVIVCGHGRVGRHLTDQLHAEGVDFVVVEADRASTEGLETAGHPVVVGDATHESTLADANVEHARTLVACVDSDADNVLLILTARGMRPDLQIIARAKSEENERKLVRAGADRVILPSSIGGRRIAQILTRPTVVAFLDELGEDGIDYQIEEVPIREHHGLVGSTLAEADLRSRFGVTVLAVRRPDGRLEQNPSPADALVDGSVLVVIGTHDGVAELRTSA